jgi:hypothetical protein
MFLLDHHHLDSCLIIKREVCNSSARALLRGKNFKLMSSGECWREGSVRIEAIVAQIGSN